MVIAESLSASRSFGLKPETEVLSSLSRFIAPLLGIYLLGKLGDIVIRETFVYLTEFNSISILFGIEIIVGVVVPLRMFLSADVRKSPTGLFIASMLVIFGVLMNRFNNFVTAYNPPYALEAYFPSVGEIFVTLGFVAIEILLYRLFVIIFPVISIPVSKAYANTKYAIRGVLK